MSKRLNIDNKEGVINIQIFPYYDPSKQRILLTWIVFWTICGIIVVSQLFFDYPRKTKLFILIYLAFWLYFEFKTVYAYRWRKFGKETIIIKDNQFHYIKSIKKRGVEQIFKLDDISSFQTIKNNPSGFQGFLAEMNNSYWSPNINTIEAVVGNQSFHFGLELEDKDRKKLLSILRPTLKNR